MKKFMYAALAVIALLALVGCKKDNKQPKSEEKADAYVSFTFNLPQSGFRAGVDGSSAGDEYAGTADEQKINEVRVVLYDENSLECKYAFDYAITTDGTAAPTGDGVLTGGTAAKFTTKARGVTSQAYSMLAIINPTTDVKTATAVGKYATDAVKALTTTVDALKNNGILMSNAKGLVGVSTSQLKATEGEAEGAPVAVSVDRILAKVFVGGQPTFENGELKDIKWQLNTTNTKTYIFRKFGKVAKGDGENFVDEDPVSTESYYTRFNSYAEDPNFFSYQFDATHSDFNYIEGTLDLKNTFGFDDANGEYCLENTMDAGEQKHNRTTSFVLSGVWVPATHDGITFEQGKSWYSFMGFTFTTEKMKEYIGKVRNDTDPNNPDLPGTPAGFKAALNAMITPTPPAPGEPTPAYSVDETTGEPTASGTVNDIKAYKDGKCYYQTNLIRHFKNAQSKEDMHYGRYGVVRNNIYKISITKISQPGEPTITPEKEDDGDDDPTKVFVSFDITVNPWIVRTQNISL